MTSQIPHDSAFNVPGNVDPVQALGLDEPIDEIRCFDCDRLIQPEEADAAWSVDYQTHLCKPCRGKEGSSD
jgi:hypothetical protein